MIYSTSPIVRGLSVRCFSALLRIALFLAQTVFVSPLTLCFVDLAVSTFVRFSWQAVDENKQNKVWSQYHFIRKRLQQISLSLMVVGTFKTLKMFWTVTESVSTHRETLVFLGNKITVKQCFLSFQVESRVQGGKEKRVGQIWRERSSADYEAKVSVLTTALRWCQVNVINRNSVLKQWNPVLRTPLNNGQFVYVDEKLISFQ